MHSLGASKQRDSCQQCKQKLPYYASKENGMRYMIDPCLKVDGFVLLHRHGWGCISLRREGKFQVKYSHSQNTGQRPVVTMALRYLEDCSKKRLFLHFSMAFVGSLSPGGYLVKYNSNHTTVFSLSASSSSSSFFNRAGKNKPLVSSQLDKWSTTELCL